MYIIFGSNDIGSTLAINLKKSDEEVLVIDNDENALAGLKDYNLQILATDINVLNFESLQGKDVIAFVLSQKNHKDNVFLAKQIKGLFPDKFILSKAIDEKEVSELLENGVDRTVQPVKIITNAILNELETAKLKQAVFRLVSVLKAAVNKGIAIFLQDNPDPDAIASGLALKRIADKYDIKCKIYYGGNIGHQQNRTLVNLLETDLIRLQTSDESLDVINAVDKVALIEASIPSKNNILPANIVPNIIIDHHQVDLKLVKGEFVEILPKMGANSTIMTRYLRQLDIVPDPPLATALRYGIRTDTNGFTRNTTTEDLDAAAYLSSLVDVGLLNQIENPPMSAETIDIIGRAIRNREVKGSYLISFVEFITDRDALPQAAELLLQMEGITTVLIFGIDKDKVQLSARSTDSRVNLASLLQKAFGFMNAGGHATMAAGTIDLGIFGDVTDKKSLLRITFDAIRKKFFSAVGIDIEKKDMPDDLELMINSSRD
ncbi:MAG: DHH family phosphoesterase [Candidatus Loosdrechtia sp.]|uniref:DHH family phosphoesterase n=1 Tax=Candidatus Loosdrechtia sp. TaxID=3101272 RepID=UPI003A74BD31|nr:MAG: DHH family phosphoesterase [Candidatus Jettenia sp. AMX2]